MIPGQTRALQIEAERTADRFREWRDVWRTRFHNELATNLGLRFARSGECSEEYLRAASDLMGIVGWR